VTRRGGTKRKQLLYDFQKTRSYWKLKDEELDRAVRRTRFGKIYGYVLDYKCKAAVMRVLISLPDFFSEI
jgi:hypothetical protein